ncbi:MAG: 4Fe-4S dicluster domain-containing protein [Elusimicrobiota bacterium]
MVVKERIISIKAHSTRCKGCALCIDVCPKKILKLSNDLNEKGYHYIVITDADECIGCGACYTVCPDCVFEIKVS